MLSMGVTIMASETISQQLLANAGSAPVRFEPGEVIFRQGDQGDAMYVVRSGDIDIEIDGKIVETLSQGAVFGEMALIDRSARSATARAKTPCEVSPIAEKNFLFLVDEMPFFALFVMRALVDRLRRMNKLL
jgi:CRP/FNR family cyclic AMP-dependent transcriptional regulator